MLPHPHGYFSHLFEDLNQCLLNLAGTLGLEIILEGGTFLTRYLKFQYSFPHTPPSSFSAAFL